MSRTPVEASAVLATPVSTDLVNFIRVSEGNAVKECTVATFMGQSNSASISAGSALTLTLAASAGKLVLLDTATGSTVTLPPATGSGASYRFAVTVIATSNNHIIKVANVNDAFQGYAFSMDDTAANAVGFYAVAGTDDTITLNRSTTGSVTRGETIVVRDIATNLFQIDAFISNTGTPATPFSATV